jgi:hypothetical protein
MSTSLRVVTAFLNDSNLSDEVKQALRDALLIESTTGSSSELERLIDNFIDRGAK